MLNLTNKLDDKGRICMRWFNSDQFQASARDQRLLVPQKRQAIDRIIKFRAHEALLRAYQDNAKN